MKKPIDDEAAAVRARRAQLIRAALGGLALPILASDCASDPQPCLSVIPDRPGDGSSAARDEEPPPGWEGIWVSRRTAASLGLPPIGLRASLTRGGFEVFPPRAEVYAQLSGPPGGPLGFRAVALRAGASRPDVSAEELLRAALEGATGLEPVVVGAAERVTLGGEPRMAQAVRTGREHAATDHCLVRVPEKEGADVGMLLVFSVPAASEPPTCGAVLAHAALAELVGTLQIEGG
jgi:hypothetical protein